MRRTAFAFALAAAIAVPARADDPAVVAVAASVRDVAREAAATLAARFGPDAFAIHAGGSGALARQIERGAPVGVYVSAASDEVDALARAGLVIPGSRATLAANRLVLIGATGIEPAATLAELAAPRFRRIAIANPRTAPAGRYALSALDRAGVRATVEPRAVFGENVRQVLEYVARGDADAGLVYASDVLRFAGRVVVSDAVVPEVGPPILVVGARIRGEGEDPRARAFLDWLRSADGLAAFERAGFLPPPAPIAGSRP